MVTELLFQAIALQSQATLMAHAEELARETALANARRQALADAEQERNRLVAQHSQPQPQP